MKKSILVISMVLSFWIATPVFAQSEVTGTLTAGSGGTITGSSGSSGTTTLSGTVTPGNTLTGTVTPGNNLTGTVTSGGSGGGGSSGSGGGGGSGSSGGGGGGGGTTPPPDLVFGPNVGVPNTGAKDMLPMNVLVLATALGLGLVGYRLYRRPGWLP